DRPGLVVGAAGPRPAERLLPDDRTGRLVVDVEVARREAQRVGGARDRPPVLVYDRAGQRVGRDVGGLGDHLVVAGVIVDVDGEDRPEILGGEHLVGRGGALQQRRLGG